MNYVPVVPAVAHLNSDTSVAWHGITYELRCKGDDVIGIRPNDMILPFYPDYEQVAKWCKMIKN